MSSSIPDIKYIAEQAGVSITTVSRVINNPARVNAKTREMVQAIIDQYSYRPNPSAQSIHSGRSGLIGMLLPSYNGINGQILEGAIQEASEHDMSIVVSPTYTSFEKETEAILNFINKPLDGLIYLPAIVGQNIPQIDYFSNIPIIGLRELVSFPCKKIWLNHERVGYLATRYLLKRNHKAIAMVISTFSGYPANSIDELEAVASSQLAGAYSIVGIYVGYRAALKEAGVPFDPSLIFFIDVNGDNSSINLQLLRFRHKIDKVITMACHASQLLDLSRMQGVAVPEEFSVLSIDQINATLTYVDRRGKEVGRLAVKTIISMIKGNSIDDIIVEPKLVIK